MPSIHVVEDDHDISEIIVYLLEDSGFEVNTSATAKEFTEFIASGRPDLILMDVKLPDGNGEDLCRKIKLNKKTSSIPVIIMSAHAKNVTIYSNGCANDFIAKPFDIDDFIKRVKMQLVA